LDAALRFVYANRAAQEFFSAATKDLIGASVWDLGPEGAMSLDFYNQLRKCTENQSAVCFESTSGLHADRTTPSNSG
jgi:nitrogen-specific signal transduction histidine kinase